MSVLYVAEIGSNHKGIPSLAYEYIRQAALAGADMAKFQLGHCPGDGVQAMRHWPTENVVDLHRWCFEWGIEFFASVFSMDGLEAARSVDMGRYKIASEKAFRSHSNESLSGLYLEMLRDEKEIFTSWEPNVKDPLVRMLYCIPKYPTYLNECRIPTYFLPKYYGYSSHVHGYADALVAVSRGAKYIEKHVTLNKTENSIKDNHFALSFGEFANMVKLGKQIERIR